MCALGPHSHGDVPYEIGDLPEYGRTAGRLWKVVYMCEFNMDTAYMHVEGDSIADFKEGFWLNDKYELTKGSDAKYWMPPSSIIRVCKEKKLIH